MYAKLIFQYKTLGYCTSILPKAPKDVYFVCDITGTYKNFVSLYKIRDGSTLNIKFAKSKNLIPLEKNQIIKRCEFMDRFKKRKIGVDSKGKPIFEETDQMERVLSKYVVVQNT